MPDLNRRSFIQASGASVAAMFLAACSGGSGASSSGGPQGSGQLTWWDHFNPLSDLHKKTFSAFQEETGVAVEYTLQQTANMGQSLQLAKQSDQLPDVHSNVGLELPLPALIREGWYQPLQLSQEALDRIGSDTLVEGIHSLNGDVYTFPIFNFRQYWALNWFNTELVEKAGLDPQRPPTTYDEFRSAARAVQDKAADYSYVLGLGQPPRIREQVNYLAQAGGFEGNLGLDFRTGEYRYEHDAYVNAIEFLLSMKTDGLLVPGSESWNDKIARARWASGSAAYYFDGPWCAGVISQDLPQFAEKLGVGPMLVPEQGQQVTAYRGPQAGAFYISGSSGQVELASQLLEWFTRSEYSAGLAENMDQPPSDLSVVESAGVLPAYQKAIQMFEGASWLAPVPQAQNIEIATVQSLQREIQPDLGQVVQGLFSGQLTDVRKELRALSDRHSAERENALAEAEKEGAEVELDDWAFPDWTPRADYTPDRYGA